jgi:drug/metabolite transporter (DMT)-like permease
MALCAIASWGFYSILLDAANERGISPLAAIRRAFGWSLAMMAPFVAWGMTESGICALDGSFAVMLDAAANAQRFADPVNWMNIAFLGLLASAASFVLWSAACKSLGVVKTTVALYLTPIVGVVFAATFLGERVTWLEVVGGGVILVGVAIATAVKGGVK